MRVGYARISTETQNLDLQKDALARAGCERVFVDVASGAIDTRVGLKEALEFVRPGDILTVWRLDRLGRSLQHLVEMVNALSERGIGFSSLQENLDTSSSGGRFIFHFTAALSQFERDLIRDRTLAGLKAARERGRLGGRPKLLSKEDVNLLKRIARDTQISVADVCKRFGISRSTLYRTIGAQAAIQS
jgi:DNA invertase Pin-like site-specific DNA recombinase